MPERRVPDIPSCLAAAGNIGIGVVLLLGAPSRTSGPSFTYLRELAPVRVWGVLFLVAGSVALYGSTRRGGHTERWGHFACGVLCALLVGCFVGAWAFPTASLTGVVAYAALAALHLWTAAGTLRTGSHRARR